MKKLLIIKWIGSVIALLLLPACTNLLFVPTRPHVLTPDKVNIKYSDIELPAPDGLELHGWYLPASVPARGSILFLHGNGENISTHLASVYWLPAEGYDVYLFDYRGYGKSEGEVDLAGSMQDIESMITYVAAHKTTPQKMIVLGHSMGASMGIYAVSQSPHKNDIAGMISVGAFSDYRTITRDALSRSWLTWLFQWPLSLTIDNKFSPKKYIADISPLPVVVMHSDTDEIIDPYHAGILFDAAAEPKYFQLLHSDHNHVFNYAENRQALLQQLSRFQMHTAMSGVCKSACSCQFRNNEEDACVGL